MSSNKSNGRRKSMAVADHNKPNSIARSRRRAHSLAPGERLSPLARARRSMAPRKSILKASVAPPMDEDPQQLPSSSQPPQSSQGGLNDSMIPSSQDTTREFHTTIHDNTSRKSLGRRVSFASHAQVRVFEKENNPKVDSSPQSSTTPDKENPQPTPPAVTDENAYPGASKHRRRSSVRKSVGFSAHDDSSMDMDMDDPSDWVQASQNSGSAIADDEKSDSVEVVDMDLTTALGQRKTSIGGAPRRGLSIIPSDFQPQHNFLADDEDGDTSQYDENSTVGSNQSLSDMDVTGQSDRPVEYDHPLTKPLNPPGPPSEAWLALRSMTHSGDTSYEPPPSEDEEGESVQMELTDAVDRLLKARPSLPGVNAQLPDDDSLISTDESFNENADYGDKTINMSRVLGRPSIGGSSLLDSTMDVTNAVGGVLDQQIDAPTAPHPQPSSAPPPPPVFSLPPPFTAIASMEVPETRRPSVFQPPHAGLSSSSSVVPQKVFSTPQADPTRLPQSATITKPSTFSSAPKPTSPSKLKPDSSSALKKSAPKLSAAFAPPVTRLSPRKRPRPSENRGDEFAGVDSEDGPSSRKKLAMAASASASGPETDDVFSVQPSESTERPQAVPVPDASDTLQTQNPKSAAIRRPSNYFARRRSLGVGLARAEPSPGPSAQHAKSGMARASMGGAPLGPLPSLKGKERGESRQCDKEVTRQAVASPTINRGSPAPASPRQSSPRPTLIRELDPNRTQTPDSQRTVEEDLGEESESEKDAPDVDSTEQWRDGVVADGLNNEDSGPPISIEQFFEMTGVRFMDDLTAPRRSTIHPSQLQLRQRRASSGGTLEIPLAEYAVAMTLDAPQFDLFTHVTRDLQAWIDQRKEAYRLAEEEAAKVTPELFREYAQANEEGQAELLNQLQLIKAYTRGTAKSEWYDWKHQWISSLHEEAVEGFHRLEEDAELFDTLNKRAQQTLPSLQAEHDQLVQELEREQADVAEIEGDDPGYLKDLKVSIAEQDAEIEALQAELAESDSQLKWLNKKLDDMDLQKQEFDTTIQGYQRQLSVEKSATVTEINKLKEELQTFEYLLHLRKTQVRSDLMEFICLSRFRVTIPCSEFQPIPGKVEIVSVLNKAKANRDHHPHLSAFFLKSIRDQINSAGQLSTQQILQGLNDYWASIYLIENQIRLFDLKYPLKISTHEGYFKIVAPVIFSKTKGKAHITLTFDEETFSTWPHQIASVKLEVEQKYGPISTEKIYETIEARMRETTPISNHAFLLDACIGASALYP